MRALVFLEESDGELTTGARGLVAKARELSGDSCAVLCGSGVLDLANQVSTYGASRLFVADDPALGTPLSQPRVEIIAALVRLRGFDTVLLENSSLAADIAGALAARLDAGVNWDLIDVRHQDGDLLGIRLALGDTVLATVGWKSDVRIAVVRRGILTADEDHSPSEVQAIGLEQMEPASRVRPIQRVGRENDATRLDDAEIIVGGGRGFEHREDLVLLEQLAEALGGAVAVTMPLVDRGWYPYSQQVGQTGRVVTPRLYMACGISGAIQHRVGMERSGTIVAVNTNPADPIFGFADIGVVADVRTFLPKLTERIRARRPAT